MTIQNPVNAGELIEEATARLRGGGQEDAARIVEDMAEVQGDMILESTASYVLGEHRTEILNVAVEALVRRAQATVERGE